MEDADYNDNQPLFNYMYRSVFDADKDIQLIHDKLVEIEPNIAIHSGPGSQPANPEPPHQERGVEAPKASAIVIEGALIYSELWKPNSNYYS